MWMFIIIGIPTIVVPTLWIIGQLCSPNTAYLDYLYSQPGFKEHKKDWIEEMIE